MSYSPPVYNAEAPRYTTLEAVKEVLGIDSSIVDKDARLTSAIVAAESTLDIHMHRSMPDVDDTEGPQPPTLIVPSAWSETAKAAAIGIYKSAEAPMGSAGNDDWLGVINVPQIVADTVRRNPLMVGWQVKFGVR